MAPFIAPLHAQSGVRRVALVAVGDPTRPPLSALAEGLRDLGYVEGKNLELLLPAGGDDQKAKGAGATAYIAKPYSPRDLLTLIRSTLPEA